MELIDTYCHPFERNSNKVASSRAAPVRASSWKSPSGEEIEDEEAHPVINPPINSQHILEASDSSDDVDTHTQKQSCKTTETEAGDADKVEIVEAEEVEEDDEAKLSPYLLNISMINF